MSHGDVPLGTSKWITPCQGHGQGDSGKAFKPELYGFPPKCKEIRQGDSRIIWNPAFSLARANYNLIFHELRRYTVECLLLEVAGLYIVWSLLNQVVNTCILSQNHAFRSQCTSFDNFLVSLISETFHFSTCNCLQMNYKSRARILWPAVVFMYKSARNDFHHFILFAFSWSLARPTSVYTWPRSSWTVESEWGYDQGLSWLTTSLLVSLKRVKLISIRPVYQSIECLAG